MTKVIRAQSAPWNRAIELLIYSRNDSNGLIIPGKLKDGVALKDRDIQGMEIEPTISIPRDSAQTLLDDLWNCGLRPTDGVDSPGELRATKYHLEDMRKLLDRILNPNPQPIITSNHSPQK